MTLYKNKYRIESTRLPEWDYSNPAYYFITVCTKNRECLFGEIIDTQVILNEYGEIVMHCWNDLPNHYHNIRNNPAVWYRDCNNFTNRNIVMEKHTEYETESWMV